MGYRTILLLTLLVLVQLQSGNLPPKLPLYVGKGYDLLLGNPISSLGEKGFKNFIYELDYKDNVKTQDGKYLVPDRVLERKLSKCSLTTDVQVMRGTASYSKELKTKTIIGGGYEGVIVGSAFSASKSYENVSKATVDSS